MITHALVATPAAVTMLVHEIHAAGDAVIISAPGESVPAQRATPILANPVVRADVVTPSTIVLIHPGIHTLVTTPSERLWAFLNTCPGHAEPTCLADISANPAVGRIGGHVHALTAAVGIARNTGTLTVYTF
jgi:hypothetical protein